MAEPVLKIDASGAAGASLAQNVDGLNERQRGAFGADLAETPQTPQAQWSRKSRALGSPKSARRAHVPRSTAHPWTTRLACTLMPSARWPTCGASKPHARAWSRP